MNATHLLHDLIVSSAHHTPDAAALTHGARTLSYATLANDVEAFARGLRHLDLNRSERVGIYLDKRFETVSAFFGASGAGGVFVPINPILKAEQVCYILRDCNVRVLVSSAERIEPMMQDLASCHDLHHVVLTGNTKILPTLPGISFHCWNELSDAPSSRGHRVIDGDMAAILYTSGSTGKPKGVVLAHRNMVSGAKSVAQYLENCADDTLLAALPLSFDAGFSQLTTAFHAGARVVLLNYLMPRDVLNTMAREQVTGLTAVPPLWIQLAQLKWPETCAGRLRYIANTGGRMPVDTLTRIRKLAPGAAPYLMYGLTEAFRATYLAPDQVDQRPDSIGKAIPNSDVFVLRDDGSECAPNEPGELVQRGALVAMGYWNDAAKTAERFKPLPANAPCRQSGLMLPEMAVFSGDTVRRDEEGYLYFIGRRDEMIKTSGYRVSPNEIEEILYATRMVGECAAFGVPHETLGQSIIAICTPTSGTRLDAGELLNECRKHMPAYMIPARIEIRHGALPRNPNGKIDRNALSKELLVDS